MYRKWKKRAEPYGLCLNSHQYCPSWILTGWGVHIIGPCILPIACACHRRPVHVAVCVIVGIACTHHWDVHQTCLAVIEPASTSSSRRGHLSLGIVTGNPGVFQGYPYPYPWKPVPIPKGRGFDWLGWQSLVAHRSPITSKFVFSSHKFFLILPVASLWCICAPERRLAWHHKRPFASKVCGIQVSQSSSKIETHDHLQFGKVVCFRQPSIQSRLCHFQSGLS